MATATGMTTAAQVALWERARAGDRAAADELVSSVVPLLARYAKKYAGRFGRLDWEDDLLAVGLERVWRAVGSYKPAAGGWANYAAACGTRGMVAACKREAARPEAQVEVNGDRPVVEPLAPESDDGLRASVLAAVATLPPLERQAVEQCHGLNAGREAEFVTARRLGVTVRNLEAILGRGMKRLQTALVGDRPGV